MNYAWIGIAVMGFVFGIAAYSKVDKLEKKLRESGVLKEDREKEN